MRSERNREFDHLCTKERGLNNQNFIALFNDCIPYSFNLFSKKNNSEALKAKEMIDHLQNGYPHQGKKIRFDDKNENVYAYLLMVKTTTKFEEPNGVLARKVNYALERMNFRDIYSRLLPERFGFVLKEKLEEEEEKQRMLKEEEELNQTCPSSP